MPKLVYRVVSACGALGYGYPKESLDAALRGQVDAIICDGGSMDAGPYYLGTGTEYFETEAVKLDFRHMVEAGERIGCPVILGSCGMAGGDRNLDWMISIAKEVFGELGIQNAKVAVIRSELDPEIVIREFRSGSLCATGLGPDLDEETLRESTVVGQMGIHPLITALESGAQYILAGRSCDIALFASDMIRRNIDAGLAYHVGHVLECGALACDPGSPSDCLVAEIYDDGSAVFTVPNPARRCTSYSIAAHSLYEESLGIMRALGSRGGMIHNLVGMGSQAERLGDLATARACFEESRALDRELGVKGGHAHWFLGRMAVAAGDFARITALARQYVEIVRKHRAG